MSFIAPIKALLGLGAVVVVTALTACGSGDDSPVQPAKPPEQAQLAMSKAEIAKLPELEIKAMRGPGPQRLVTRDLRRGSGAALRPSDSSIVVNFASVNYGETIETNSALRNEESKFSMGEVVESWKEGLPGMRVGGRRELIAPDAVDYESGTVVYVVDLLAIERP